MNTNSLFKKVVNLVTISSFLFWNFAWATPQDGTVVAGSAVISQPNSQQTVINQSSQSAVINWSSFDTAAGDSVRFIQPNSSSIALNKITNGLPTNFNGNLSANGQVWIINPAGVLFGNSANINVAGLLATTNMISNNNFMSGNYIFDAPTNLSASIINSGNINIADSGVAVLVGPNVINNGSIIANLGTVQLSTGGAFVLDLYGDNLINFGSNSPISNGSVANNNLIQATGGKVFMTANAAAGILDNVISMSGVIQATTASTGQHGEIILNGGHAGTVDVSGKLDASNGGFIETSGYILVLEPSVIINAGMGGSWLIDPWDITVVGTLGTCTNIGCTQPFTPTGTNSQIGADLIVSQLNSGTDVTLYTGGANGGTDAGDITVNAPIVANSGAGNLTLTADSNIIINSPITINGSLTLNGPISGFVAIQINSPITIGGDFTANAPSGFGQIQIGENITTGGNQQYNGEIRLLQAVDAPGLVAGGFVDFTGPINSAFLPPFNLVIVAGNYVEFDARVGQLALNSLTVTAPTIYFNTDEIMTQNNQSYTGSVVLLQNMDSPGLQTGEGDIAMTPGTSIIFNGPVSSSGGNFNLATLAETTEFDDIVGGGVTPLGNLTIDSNFININNNATSITTTGFQDYFVPLINQPSVMTVNADPTFTGSNLTFSIALVLAFDTTFTANGVGVGNGNIAFDAINSLTTPVNVIVNPNSVAGTDGTAHFDSDIGVDDPLSVTPNPFEELASLTVNGTSLITNGEGNPIYFYTTGSQIYTDTVTLALVPGSSVFMYSLTSTPSPVGTNVVQFCSVSGAACSTGTIGVVEDPIGPQALTVVTNNPNNGPMIDGGVGVTGSVNITSLTLGGPGGARISTAAIPDSTVGGSGGSQARTNTIISPDFSSSGAVYCVNGFFSCVAQPPQPNNNFPDNIPPTQVFEIAYPPYFCDLSSFECKHVEYIFSNLIVGNVTGITGTVKSIRQDGTVHWLKKGDYIYSYEKVISNKNADVKIFMYSSGELIEVPETQSHLFLLDAEG